MICSSFCRAVSRLVSSLSSSSTSSERYCASSTRRMVRRPRAWISRRCPFRASTRDLALDRSLSDWMPSSSQIAVRNSTAVSCGFRISAMSTPDGIWPCYVRTNIVLPVPTSPVNWMKPPLSVTPYMRCARPSPCRSLMNRYRGSGVIVKGFSLRPKKVVYMPG